jgi:AraC-like DNA-binding protein
MGEFVKMSVLQTSHYAVDSAVQAHGFHELIYGLQGTYQAQVDGRRIALEPGQMTVYPAATPHMGLLRRDSSVRFYVLQWRAEELPTSPDPDPSSPVADANGRVLLLLRWMWEATSAPPLGEPERLGQLLDLTLAEWRRLRTRGAASLSEMAIECMRVDMKHPMSLEDLAGVLGLSVFHFIRRFKQETGITPGQYFSRLRVSRALSMLTQSDATLREIASAVGFASPEHLGRLIKRETGRSPRQLRSAIKGRPL